MELGECKELWYLGELVVREVQHEKVSAPVDKTEIVGCKLASRQNQQFQLFRTLDLLFDADSVPILPPGPKLGGECDLHVNKYCNSRL